MMATKAKVRKYSIDYLKYGFIAAPHDEGLALCLLCEHTPMKDNIFGSEAFILLTKMEMHYRRNKFQNFLQKLALDAHDGLHRKSTLAFIRHCSRVGCVCVWGGAGNDKLAIDKGGIYLKRLRITVLAHSAFNSLCFTPLRPKFNPRTGQRPYV